MDAQVNWSRGLSFIGSAESGFEVGLGGSAESGGAEDGFRPMELLLVALAGCTAMDVISILQKKEQAVTGFQVRVHGERAADHPKVFTSIHVDYVVSGREVDPAAVERAIDLSVTKYCPAHAMLAKAAEITSSYEIRPAG